MRYRLLSWPNLYLVAVAAVFVALWGTVIAGREVLVGGDILGNLPPWFSGTGAAPHNPLVSDPVTQFVPWLTLVRDQLLHGRLPLWNPSSFGGAPLLANDQSAPLSPFTVLALPFSPAVGYSLAMLLKLVVAGLGMALFLRQLGAAKAAGIVGGVVYATSSFMVVWLGHPHTAVAAIFPWAFAAVEWWLRTRRVAALVGLAVAIALQFYAGHAETTLHLGMFLAFYAAVRVVAQQRGRLRALAGLVAAAVTGTALAAVQLIPFLSELRSSTLVSDRLNSGAGLGHLQLSELVSWLIPNGHGNPGIDGAPGRFPNYLESAGFAGVAGLALAGIGLAHLWRAGRRSVAVAVAVPVALAGGVVYGPLTPIAGRLPLLSTSNNQRMLAVMCLGVATLAGLGFQALLSWRRATPPRPARRRIAAALAVVAAGCLLSLVALGGLLAARGAGVDGLLPSWHGNLGFWVLVAALSVAATVGFLLAARLGVGRLAVGGIACVVLVEASLFAGPFQPRVSAATAPPPSPALAWLGAHAGDGKVAAQGFDLIPNLAAEYGLVDARGVDITIDPRVRTYWSHADPGYDDSTYYTVLSRPGTAWLAAAGVELYMSAPDAVPPGATVSYTGAGYAISRIPQARPFAYAASTTTSASGPQAAVSALAADPLGPVVVESGSARPSAGDATVRVTRRDPGAIDLDVTAAAATTLVVSQSYAPQWAAHVDGASAPVWPADVLFQAVPVPAGHHVVTLRYSPSTVTAGLAVSALALLVVLAAALLPLVRRRSASRHPLLPSRPDAATPPGPSDLTHEL